MMSENMSRTSRATDVVSIPKHITWLIIIPTSDGSSQIHWESPKRIKWLTEPLYPSYPRREVIVLQGADKSLQKHLTDLKLTEAPSVFPPCESEWATNERPVGDAQVPAVIPAVRRSRCIDIASECESNSYMDAAAPSRNMLSGIDALGSGLPYGSGVSCVSSQTLHPPAMSSEPSNSNFNGFEHHFSSLPTAEQPMPSESSCWRLSTIPGPANEPQGSDDRVMCDSSTRDEDNFEDRRSWFSNSGENIPGVPASFSFEAPNDLDRPWMLTEEQLSHSRRRNDAAPTPGIFSPYTVPIPPYWHGRPEKAY